MKKITLFAAALFAGLFFHGSPVFGQDEAAAARQQRKAEKFAALIDQAQRRGAARVIVGLRGVSAVDSLSGTAGDEKRRKIKNEQSGFLNRHAARGLAKIKRFDFIPFLAFEADAAALAELRTDEQIETIEEDALAAPTLAESTALVGGPAVWALGFSGAGQAVAVLDSGVDKNHPFLAGKIVSEACYSSNYADATSVCPGGVTESTAAGSGANCASSISGCAHGTHVAGIVAGRGPNYSGVAKDASIIAIQVFSSVNNATDCGTSPAPCILSYSSDQLKALERVRALSATMSIAAVNMSLGGGQYTDNCDAVSPSRKAAIDALRSAGVATVVSSGNSSYSAALSSPACISTTISVGSSDDGGYSTTSDAVSSFSNSSPLLTLLAPGRYITSSVPNGGYAVYAGTSMAAPHVAGAFAVLKQKKPNATVSELRQILISTGQSVTDPRNNLTKPRLRLDRAFAALAGNAAARRAPFDFDGDGKSDLAVYRPSSATWYLQSSAGKAVSAQQFGLADDLIAPADFDGDGRADIAVFRPSTGVWYYLRSSNGSFGSAAFGTAGDIPAPFDYDGDGRADLAVFRPTGGVWWILRSSDGAVVSRAFGLAGDVPAVGDFDGDAKADISVFRPSNGVWYRLDSGSGRFYSYQFGLSGDRPAVGDFDGDGKSDISVFRPATGVWYRLNSGDNSFGVAQFGLADDLITPGDYDGDGKTDVAVFRPATGVWYLQRSASGLAFEQFGLAGDQPAAGFDAR